MLERTRSALAASAVMQPGWRNRTRRRSTRCDAQVEKKFPKKDAKLLVGCSNGTQYALDALQALDEVGVKTLKPRWNLPRAFGISTTPSLYFDRSADRWCQQRAGRLSASPALPCDL